MGLLDTLIFILMYIYMYEYYFKPPEKKRTFSGVDFVYEQKVEARAPRTNTGHGTKSWRITIGCRKNSSNCVSHI